MSEGQERDGVRNGEELNHRMSQGITPVCFRLSWGGPRLGQTHGKFTSSSGEVWRWKFTSEERKDPDCVFLRQLRNEHNLYPPGQVPTYSLRWHNSKRCKSALICKSSVISLKPLGRPDPADTIPHGVTTAVSALRFLAYPKHGTLCRIAAVVRARAKY